MPDILVTGSRGQLGRELERLVRLKDLEKEQCRFHFTDKDDLDITDLEAFSTFCRQYQIGMIINCAAYTAVDKAETERDAAEEINVQAVRNMVQIAEANDIGVVHISTDYVFDGKHSRPYKETDRPNPQNIYGRTKLQGEEILMSSNAFGIIIRTSWLYGTFGSNFVKTMLRLGKERNTLDVVYDQIGSPTYSGDLAKVILEILPVLPRDGIEVYHYTNEGVCSWYDLAETIFELSQISCKVVPVLTEAYPTPACRPAYSLMSKEKIKKMYNITIPYWKDSLKHCLEELGEGI